MDDFHTLMSLYGQIETEVINITRSYQSTKQIIEFTRRLAPNGERIIPFERDGELPALTQLLDHTELHRNIASKVVDLRDLGYHTIAIICKSAKDS
ncbi:hypothetical protein AZE41_12315 [Sporosarcina psychrophila]|nr:hypothetical protein AZE41_12315 [Sporosarcina psychrophila]